MAITPQISASRPVSLTFVTDPATMLRQMSPLVHTIRRKRQRCETPYTPNNKIRRIASSTPSPSSIHVCQNIDKESENEQEKIGKSSDASTSPHDFIVASIQDNGGETFARSSLDVQNFFVEHTEEEMRSYGVLSQAVRAHDMPSLRRFHEDGISMRCSNKFGESLIHMACRRGYVDMVKFFVKEAGVSLRVRDDYGRNPLHNACWTCEPNVELMDLLVNECPELLVMSDKRGHAPFQYARKEHWAVWTGFLQARKELIYSVQSG